MYTARRAGCPPVCFLCRKIRKKRQAQTGEGHLLRAVRETARTTNGSRRTAALRPRVGVDGSRKTDVYDKANELDDSLSPVSKIQRNDKLTQWDSPPRSVRTTAQTTNGSRSTEALRPRVGVDGTGRTGCTRQSERAAFPRLPLPEGTRVGKTDSPRIFKSAFPFRPGAQSSGSSQAKRRCTALSRACRRVRPSAQRSRRGPCRRAGQKRTEGVRHPCERPRLFSLFRCGRRDAVANDSPPAAGHFVAERRRQPVGSDPHRSAARPAPPPPRFRRETHANGKGTRPATPIISPAWSCKRPCTFLWP